MDRLTVMRSLVAVARAGSFSGAARALGVSGSLISRHIADLEEQLGVRLVNRTARTVSLTEQGRSYLEFAERLLREIDEEDAAIGGEDQRAEGVLSVVSPKWIGSLDLSDAVASFAAEHAMIDIRFDVGGTSESAYDFLEQGYDVAFHTKELREATVVARRLATLPFVLCAAPAYLRRNPAPLTPGDLGAHDCLVHRNDPVWRLRKDGDRHDVEADPAFTSNTYLILQQAALEGMGVALLPLRSVYDEVRDERLQVVLAAYEPPERPLYALFPPALRSAQRLQLFLAYVEQWFRRFPVDRSALVRADA